MTDDDKTISKLRSFEDILDDIESLSRAHLLAWRIGVGKVLLRDIFADDAQAYLSRDHTKEARFAHFLKENAVALQRYGLADTAARQSIHAALVYDALPDAVRQPLFLSQVLELARLNDGERCTELAVAAVQNNWTTMQLRDVVSAVNAGLAVDATLEVPEPQLPSPVVVPAQPGRLVTRMEKWAGDVDALTATWASVDPAKLRPVQRARLAAAVAKAQARLAVLAAAVGE